ncbi:MAG: hypothetical protein ACOYNY_11230 [Caldilineaceae bacterium]
MKTIATESVSAFTDRHDSKDLELLMKAKAIKERVARGEEKTIPHDVLKKLMLAKGAAEELTQLAS